jgi:hypothetical protein
MPGLLGVGWQILSPLIFDVTRDGGLRGDVLFNHLKEYLFLLFGENQPKQIGEDYAAQL